MTCLLPWELGQPDMLEFFRSRMPLEAEAAKKISLADKISPRRKAKRQHEPK
jgi:hypothetical protein